MDPDMEKMMAIEEELARPETSHSTASKKKRVSLVIPPSPPAKDIKHMGFPEPPKPTLNPLRGNPVANPVEEPRPMTSSSRRLTFSTVRTAKRPLKFVRTGKYAGVELAPQPSDDPDDPLNWAPWRRELNYAVLLLCVVWASTQKTAFIGLHADFTRGFKVSYTTAAALTGAPLMLSALSGLLALTVSRLWGRRPVYLACATAMFVGSIWAVNDRGSFGQLMAARMFQGLGWGAFDTIVVTSLQDTFFVSPLSTRGNRP
jgi:hypothetical protein